MNAPIPDFTPDELNQVEALLRQRYGAPVAVEPAESELQLDPASDALTVCPTLYWTAQGAHFVVFRTGPGRYRSQFFYTDADHYGTGRDEYPTLDLCVRTVLQVQADHARDSALESARANAAAAGAAGDDAPGPAIL